LRDSNCAPEDEDADASDQDFIQALTLPKSGNTRQAAWITDLEMRRIRRRAERLVDSHKTVSALPLSCIC